MAGAHCGWGEGTAPLVGAQSVALGQGSHKHIQSTAGGPRPVLVLEMGMGLPRMARGAGRAGVLEQGPASWWCQAGFQGERPSWVAGLGG